MTTTTLGRSPAGTDIPRPLRPPWRAGCATYGR